MAHHTIKSSYKQFVERINKFPQGAPPSETLYKILKMLFSEKEAGLLSLLPIRPFTVKKVERIWKMKASDAQKILDGFADRGIVVDLKKNGSQVYILPPPVIGFFEFSMIRTRKDIDQKALSELFCQYMDVEEDFVKELFAGGKSSLGRVFIKESVLSNGNELHVLDYERASEVIKTASHIGIGLCYCRHKMKHVDRACDAPLDLCMVFNEGAALPLIKHGLARRVDISECMDKLEEAHARKLVQFGSDVMNDVGFICNCCGCCCEAMIAARKFAMLNPVSTTNFIPEIKEDTCNGCGKCISVCPVGAMSMVSGHNPHSPQKKKAKLSKNICLGCGLCASVCSNKSTVMKSRPRRIITPVDSVQKITLMAIERGKLQNLIFDNQALMSHRAMAAILGVFLRLPAVKQAMVKKQMKSRYLETLVDDA